MCDMLKKVLVTALLLGVTVVGVDCSRSSSARVSPLLPGKSMEIVPEWFINLPESGGNSLLAVGYAGYFEDVKLAKSVALNSALINMAKQRQLRLQFRLEELADGRFRLLNPSFEIFYEGDILEEVRANFSLVDSAVTENGYFVLISHPSGGKASESSAECLPWGSKPDWTENVPVSDRWLYGVGMVARYSSPSKAWRDADDFARFDVGKNMQIETESIQYRDQGERFTRESILMKQTYDLVLKRAVIIQHWYDTEAGAYYSLCRMPR